MNRDSAQESTDGVCALSVRVECARTAIRVFKEMQSLYGKPTRGNYHARRHFFPADLTD